MNPVLRAVLMFVVLWIVFRIGGRRTLAEITTFDFILLLVIGDAAQNALIGDDFAITTAALVIVTLLLLDIVMGRLSGRSDRLRRVIESAPVIVIDNGNVREHVMRDEGVDIEDVLTAARDRHGLQRLDEIKFAIVERHGGISVVPKERHAKEGTPQG
jgi:uncharacterized membrane protein YcaP (DUF421 family)